MKKIIALLTALVAVIATLGIGTFAYFSDTETSTGNTITAGTLDLTSTPQAQVGFSTDSPSATQAIELTGVYPGVAGTGSLVLASLGSIGGTLDVAVGSITNTESAAGLEYTGDVTNGAGVGEIGYDTYMALFLDLDENGWDSGDVGLGSDGNTYSFAAATTGTATGGSDLTVVDSTAPFTAGALVGLPVTVTGKGTAVIIANTTDTLTVATAFTGAVVNTDAYSIASGPVYDLINNYDSVTFNAASTLDEAGGSNPASTFVIQWAIPTTVGNEIQGDAVSFDIDFQLRPSNAPGL